MQKYGIEQASFDTIVACKVLCSVPRPDEMCKNLYALLKDGGSLVALEHIRSGDKISGWFQGMFYFSFFFLLYSLWRFLRL